jgi:hypothetical protein
MTKSSQESQTSGRVSQASLLKGTNRHSIVKFSNNEICKDGRQEKEDKKWKYVAVVVGKLNSRILSYILNYIKCQKNITETPSTLIYHHPHLTSMSLWTEIPHYTVFRFTTIFDIPPHIAVNSGEGLTLYVSGLSNY